MSPRERASRSWGQSRVGAAEDLAAFAAAPPPSDFDEGPGFWSIVKTGAIVWAAVWFLSEIKEEQPRPGALLRNVLKKHR